MGAGKGEVFEGERGDGEGVAVELRHEASVGVGVVERWTGGGGAVGGFDSVQGTTCDCAEVVGVHGGVCCGACRGLAGDDVGVCDVEGFGGDEFALAEYALEGRAWEPDEVASCVHVEGYGLRGYGESEGVVASRREWE